MTAWLAKWLDRFLDRFFPMPDIPANWLADLEADIDVWEPPLADWEKELRDAYYMTDEQWAARYLHPAGKSIPPEDLPSGLGATDIPPVRVPPADTTAASAAPGVGGLPDYIEALVADFRLFLTDLFRK